MKRRSATEALRRFCFWREHDGRDSIRMPDYFQIRSEWRTVAIADKPNRRQPGFPEVIADKPFHRQTRWSGSFRCLLRLGGVPGRIRIAQAHDVAQRRLAEQTPVLAAELRGAFVADPMTRGGRIEHFAEHQSPRFMKPQLLLVLKRAHRRHRLEVVMQRRRTHIHVAGDRFDAQRLVVVIAQQANRFRDALRMAAGQRDLAQTRTLPVHDQAIVDFALDQRREDRNVVRRIEQAYESHDRVDERRRHARHEHAARRFLRCRSRQIGFAQQRTDAFDVEVQAQAQIRMIGRHAHDLGDARQIDGRHEVVQRVVDIRLIADHQLL